MRFRKKGKLSSCYVGPYQIMRRIGKAAYELDFPNDLASVHLIFHVSLLKKCVRDLTTIVPLGRRDTGKLAAKSCNTLMVPNVHLTKDYGVPFDDPE
ncbi:hypothetical protein MTR67_044905 [Solanum verrucosum]|uniref:Tf2-1-like SH3-like domain-containing protein n=1 Tax=Solanum verrucosum TaxID=315347 RepID=A0AAF0URQ1_SOLVR|nr:hypothetical protein MTR67_044905 [Solanum verrucosum]